MMDRFPTVYNIKNDRQEFIILITERTFYILSIIIKSVGNNIIFYNKRNLKQQQIP